MTFQSIWKLKINHKFTWKFFINESFLICLCILLKFMAKTNNKGDENVILRTICIFGIDDFKICIHLLFIFKNCKVYRDKCMLQECLFQSLHKYICKTSILQRKLLKFNSSRFEEEIVFFSNEDLAISYNSSSSWQIVTCLVQIEDFYHYFS